MNRLLSLACVIGACALASAARAVPFRHPSDCQDGCMVVSAYFDHGGYTDWACGQNTYGGHHGTDFATYGGYAAVDEGRAVVAAVDGVVIAAHDGEFDRCGSGTCAGGGGFGNHVAIEDADGVVTWYAHMRQGSVSVSVGQGVTCGQFLGFIASSGYSTGPHLHFEPRAPGSFDPFGGPCSGGSSWVGQNDYNALPAQQCHNPNRAPRGYVDAASCDVGVVGWAQDEDTPDAPIDVHVYLDGEAGSGARGFAIRADQHRDDLCGAIGSCAHGYAFGIPRAWRNNQPHTAFAYGIDSAGGHNPLLAGSGVSFTCAEPPLPFGDDDVLLRHVTSPESMAAWSFSFDDVGPLAPGVRATLADGAPWPVAPSLVQATGQPEVWLIDDGGARRHVTSPESLGAWRFAIESIVSVSPDELALYPLAEPLVAMPVLVSADGAVFLVDKKPPVPNEPHDPDDPTDPNDPRDENDESEDEAGATGERRISTPPVGSCTHAPTSPLTWLALALLVVRYRRARALSVIRRPFTITARASTSLQR